MSCLGKERRLQNVKALKEALQAEEARMSLRRIEEGFGNKIWSW